MDKPPFDPVKASFYLIASILGVHCLVVLVSLCACLWWGEAVVQGKWTCENISNHISQLLAGALAAALAFSAGFNRKDKDK
jgi:hypothetical protein